MKRLSLAITSLLIAMLACNMPSGQNQGLDAAATAAAQTVAVKLTSAAQTQAASGAPVASVTNTLAGAAQPTTTATPPTPPSATPQPPTLTPLPCNLAAFVQDVTVPDDSNIQTGQSFTKIWRLKNIGTCTWTSSYQLVFDHGNQMGGPVSQALTSGTVAPGAMVDISVALIAPTTEGSYQGFWRLRDPSNVLFGLSTGSFFVKIKSVAPGPTPTRTLPPPAIATVVNVPIVFGDSGAACSDGSTIAYPNIGDLANNASCQGFVSFNMSAIPAGAHIVWVKLNFSNYDMLGNPFGALGYMRIYPQNYGAVDPSDYFSGSALGALMLWSDSSALDSTAGVPPDNALTTYMQTRVGSARAKFRVQFNDTTTNSDGVADMVRLGNSIYLIVAYVGP